MLQSRLMSVRSVFRRHLHVPRGVIGFGGRPRVDHTHDQVYDSAYNILSFPHCNAYELVPNHERTAAEAAVVVVASAEEGAVRPKLNTITLRFNAEESNVEDDLRKQLMDRLPKEFYTDEGVSPPLNNPDFDDTVFHSSLVDVVTVNIDEMEYLEEDRRNAVARDIIAALERLCREPAVKPVLPQKKSDYSGKSRLPRVASYGFRSTLFARTDERRISLDWLLKLSQIVARDITDRPWVKATPHPKRSELFTAVRVGCNLLEGGIFNALAPAGDSGLAAKLASWAKSADNLNSRGFWPGHTSLVDHARHTYGLAVLGERPMDSFWRTHEMVRLQHFDALQGDTVAESLRQAASKAQALEDMYEDAVKNANVLPSQMDSIPKPSEMTFVKYLMDNFEQLTVLPQWDFQLHHNIKPDLRWAIKSLLNIPAMHYWAVNYDEAVNQLFEQFTLAGQLYAANQSQELTQYLDTFPSLRKYPLLEQRAMVVSLSAGLDTVFTDQDEVLESIAQLSPGGSGDMPAWLLPKEEALTIIRKATAVFGGPHQLGAQ